jgi:hypothetical protein
MNINNNSSQNSIKSLYCSFCPITGYYKWIALFCFVIGNGYINILPKVIEKSVTSYFEIKRENNDSCCVLANRPWCCNKTFLIIDLIFNTLLLEFINYFEIISYVQEFDGVFKVYPEALKWLIPRKYYYIEQFMLLLFY